MFIKRWLRVFSISLLALLAILLLAVIGLFAYKPSPAEGFAFSSAGKTIQLSDGRTLAYLESGDPNGRPVFFYVHIPLLHIVDVTAEAIAKKGFRKVGLIGTQFTMEQSFYRSRLENKHGLEVIIPPEQDRALVDRVIGEELGHGKILETSRADHLRIIDDLARQGAEGVILGCTEISLLVQQQNSNVPLFDTTAIHAQAAALHALSA